MGLILGRTLKGISCSKMRIYQYYNTNDDDDRDGYTANWMAQTFTPETDHVIGKVKLKLFRVGDPGTITVSIKATSGGKPVGADLCSGTILGTDITLVDTGEWYEISFGDGFDLDIGVQYAIVVRAPSGDASNKVSWRADITDPTFTGGTFVSSSDSGVDWSTVSGVDCMFEEWGVGPASPSTIVWGNLFKSQISAEKIEEAILRLIQDHEDDPDAHLETGESLESHKASVIIDHVVDSIIADKILAGEIGRSHLSDDAVILGTENFDKGALINFTDFTSAISGSASIVKQHRNNKVKTGSTVNSVAQVYTEFDQQGDLWDPGDDLELQIHYYIDGDWGWETAAGTEIYIKYGMGLNADMGLNTDKSFGIQLKDDAAGNIIATAFVRDGASLDQAVMDATLEMEASYVFRITKIGSAWKFYINGVLKASLTESISGTIGTPYLVHVAKNPVDGGWGEGLISQISYFFPY